jgi:hypothetical protein
MSTLAANECRRQVRYDYTPNERIAKATGLAESLNRYTATENEKKRIAKDYDARLDIIQAEIDQLNNSVLSGYELREYLCRWSYDEPTRGRKTLRKVEGGEIVAEEDMTERDRQMIIEIIDSQAAKGETTPGEKLTLPMPKDWPETVEDLNPGTISRDEDWIFDNIRDLLTDVDETILSREIAIEMMPNFLRSTPESELRMILDFIAAKGLSDCVGWSFIRVGIASYLDAEKAKAAAKKAASKKGRKASSSGTVDIPADEGTRDDSGPDSKNNL